MIDLAHVTVSSFTQQQRHTELRAHVLCLQDAIQKTRRVEGRDALDLVDLLPHVFDDEVSVISVFRSRDSNDYDYQGDVNVTYSFRGKKFDMSISYGSCGRGDDYELSDYDTTVLRRLIPFVQFYS